MKQRNYPNIPAALLNRGIAIAASAVLIGGCATAVQAPGGGGGISLPGGGISMPGGGSSGGGSSGGGSSGGGSSGGGMGIPSGGSSGGGSSGGGGMSMPGGGSSGGSSGGSDGGSSGGSPGGAGGQGGGSCEDGGISGGGIGGGAGCPQPGSIGEFPTADPNRAEQLGEELDKSVGDFDEALGEEQRQVASVGRDTEGFGDGSGGSGGTVSLGEQEAGASSSGSGSGAGAGGGGGSQESQAGPLDGMSDQEIQARTPEDIEVSAFDDIVARQLREAALAEDDPQLRERLWQEYRKYKGIQ